MILSLYWWSLTQAISSYITLQKEKTLVVCLMQMKPVTQNVFLLKHSFNFSFGFIVISTQAPHTQLKTKSQNAIHCLKDMLLVTDAAVQLLQVDSYSDVQQ